MTHSTFIIRYVKKLVRSAYRAIQKVQSFHVLKIASALCAQLASLYLVQVLTTAEYGQFALIASIAQLMFVLTSGWSNGAIINLGSQSFARTGTYKSVVFYRICIVTVCFIAVSLAFMLQRHSIEYFMKIPGLFAYVMILFLGYVLYDHASQLLYPGNRDKIQAGLEFLAAITLLLLVAIAVKNLQDYVYAYTSVYAGFAIVVSLLFFRLFKKHSFEWNNEEFKSVLNYSSWQIIGVISIYITNMGSNYVLVACDVSLDKIGVYNLAYRLYSSFAPFFSLFGILIPKWIHSSASLKYSVGKKLVKIVLVLSVLYLVSGLAFSPLLRIFEMQRYMDSVKYYFFLFPAFFLTSYSNLLNTVIANSAKFRSAQVGIALQSAALVISSFPLVSEFGISGAIASITIASTVGAVYFHKIYRKTFIQMST